MGLVCISQREAVLETAESIAVRTNGGVFLGQEADEREAVPGGLQEGTLGFDARPAVTVERAYPPNVPGAGLKSPDVWSDIVLR